MRLKVFFVVKPIFTHAGKPFFGATLVHGVAYLNLEACARGLGFTQVAKSGNEVVRWERVNSYLQELGFIPTSGDRFIPENIFYRLAMKAKNETAENSKLH